MTERETIEDEAAGWLLRREQPGWSTPDQVQLDAWLEENPEHKITFWRLEYGWDRASQMRILETRPKPQKAWVTWAVAAGISVVALTGGWMSLRTISPAPQEFRTPIGEVRPEVLADGTRIDLNTATDIRAKVSRTSRTVWLGAGEAYFDVAHDPSHPFVIVAGSRRITVLGTKFSVRRDGDRVEVAVTEGRVRVEPADKSAGATVLIRGDSLLAEGASTLLLPRSPKRVEDDMGWRQGRLIFDQVTLADAAAEFNRYNQKKLIISGSVASTRIGGSFESQNVEGFARLLNKGFGLTVDSSEDGIKISE
jgi:transmembrane sensor